MADPAHEINGARSGGLKETKMRIDEKFNKREAKLVSGSASVISGRAFALGVRILFKEDTGDARALACHMTPVEALKLAEELIGAARARLEDDPTFEKL